MVGTLERHLAAALATTILLTAVPIEAYVAAIVLSGDVGGPLNLVIVPLANCIVAAILSSLLLVWALVRGALRRPPLPSPTIAQGVAPFPSFLAAVVIMLACMFTILLGVSLRDLQLLDPESGHNSIALQFVRFAFLGGFPLVGLVPAYLMFLRLFGRIGPSSPPHVPLLPNNSLEPTRTAGENGD